MNVPILSAGMNCESATSRKYRLKKNLNCSYRTTGKNVNKLYFWLRTMFGGNLDWNFSAEHSGAIDGYVQGGSVIERTEKRNGYLEV